MTTLLLPGLFQEDRGNALAVVCFVEGDFRGVPIVIGSIPPKISLGHSRHAYRLNVTSEKVKDNG
jgi:hypothetical protein